MGWDGAGWLLLLHPSAGPGTAASWQPHARRGRGVWNPFASPAAVFSQQGWSSPVGRGAAPAPPCHLLPVYFPPLNYHLPDKHSPERGGQGALPSERRGHPTLGVAGPLAFWDTPKPATGGAAGLGSVRGAAGVHPEPCTRTHTRRVSAHTHGHALTYPCAHVRAPLCARTHACTATYPCHAHSHTLVHTRAHSCTLKHCPPCTRSRPKTFCSLPPRVPTCPIRRGRSRPPAPRAWPCPRGHPVGFGGLGVPPPCCPPPSRQLVAMCGRPHLSTQPLPSVLALSGPGRGGPSSHPAGCRQGARGGVGGWAWRWGLLRGLWGLSLHALLKRSHSQSCVPPPLQEAAAPQGLFSAPPQSIHPSLPAPCRHLPAPHAP